MSLAVLTYLMPLLNKPIREVNTFGLTLKIQQNLARSSWKLLLGMHFSTPLEVVSGLCDFVLF